MQYREEITPVLIVGAGPSGLMMALMLSRFGIPVHIIDKEVKKSPYSRAIAVQIRSLEIFSALGLLPKLMERGLSVDAFQVNTESAIPIDINPQLSTSKFSRPLIVDQPHTEEVLESALGDFDVYVDRGVCLVKVVEGNLVVKAELKGLDNRVFHREYSSIIGADGAHSTVRKNMDNSFIGKAYEDAFILADVEVATNIDRNSLKLYFKGPKFLALIPMWGPHHYRLISVRQNERSKMGPEPTRLEFQKLLDNIVPFPIAITKSIWVSRFFVQCRSALHYQQGRIFLVGDAAHIHSPAGGQGMNTGLQDALNLSFKLAMVLRGEALPSVLLSYHEERKPVGDFLIKYTDRLFRFMVRGSFFARLLRRIVLPRVMRSPQRQSKIFRIGSQTAIRYQKGCLCLENHALSLPAIAIGSRVPNLELIDSHVKKTDIHSQVINDFFNLLLFIPRDLEKNVVKKIIKAGHDLCEKYAIKIRPIFASDFDAEKIMMDQEYSITCDQDFLRGQEEAFFMMVRADQHLFCLGFLSDLDHLDHSLSKYLTRIKM
jgi:2-polyprenyl-6-methoxyphenol hydroxylase-like FAD-dependent oxidoreductase